EKDLSLALSARHVDDVVLGAVRGHRPAERGGECPGEIPVRWIAFLPQRHDDVQTPAPAGLAPARQAGGFQAGAYFARRPDDAGESDAGSRIEIEYETIRHFRFAGPAVPGMQF